MVTIIKAKENLYNIGQCFTKGKEYSVNGHVNSLFYELTTVNDLGQRHGLGTWYKKFKIVRYENN